MGSGEGGGYTCEWATGVLLVRDGADCGGLQFKSAFIKP